MTSGFMERLAGGYYLEFERWCLGSYASKSPMGVLDYPEGRAGAAPGVCTGRRGGAPGDDVGVRPMEREEELHHAAVKLARERLRDRISSWRER